MGIKGKENENEVTPLLSGTNGSLQAEESPPPVEQPTGLGKYISRKNALVLFYVLMVILLGTANRVTFRIMFVPMKNYPYFLNQLAAFVYILFFGTGALYKILFTHDVTPEQWKIKWWKWAIIASFASAASVMLMFGGSKIPGSMQTLLLQGVIPVTVVGSIIFLKQKYNLGQLSGAAVIISGIFLALYPSLVGGGSAGAPGWNLLVLLSSVPQAASSIVQEIVFTAIETDVFFMNFWVSVYQFIFGFPAAPLIVIPGIVTSDGIPWKDIPQHLLNGAKCLFESEDGMDGDDCYGAFYATFTYLSINLLWNVFLLLVIKHGTAALMYIASTVTLPLANIAFTFKLPLLGARPLSDFDIGGLVVIVSGLIIYRYFSVAKKEQSDETVSSIALPGMGGELVGTISRPRPTIPLVRSAPEIRNRYMSKLGIPATGIITKSYIVERV